MSKVNDLPSPDLNTKVNKCLTNNYKIVDETAIIYGRCKLEVCSYLDW